MITVHTPESLRAFEADIAEHFNAGEIRAPVHLAGGNEWQLIELFSQIREQDWVCGAWRMHYHCLLKGVSSSRLKSDILAGRSIALCYPEYRIISSAIAGGILPIALGLAWSVKHNGSSERVWVFVGDMTANMGTYSECLRYAIGHDLPIQFVVEDNGLSVCTPTMSVWGMQTPQHVFTAFGKEFRYFYVLTWPHSGAGKRINF